MIRTLGFKDALYESAILPSRPRICVETRHNHEIHEVMTKHCSHSV